MEKDISTENRIKAVAYQLFQEKGYAGTTTREIATKAEVNISLLNYYFRSKEKLFDIVMMSSIRELFWLLSDIINNEKTTLQEKIETIVAKYIDTISTNPHLPIFVLGELRSSPQRLIKNANIPEKLLEKSYFYKQLFEQIRAENLQIAPYHIILNIISMSVLPVVGKPFICHLGSVDDAIFEQMMNERKRMIPEWIGDMLKLKSKNYD